MLAPVFGTPSDLTAVVLKVVQTMVEVAMGSYDWLAAGTADDLTSGWAAREHEHVVLFADIPSREIVDLLRQAEIPAIVVIEAPGEIVRAVRRSRQIVGLPAIRFASQSLATLHDLALLPHARIVAARDGEQPIATFAAELASLLQMPVEAHVIDGVLHRLQPGRGGGGARIRDLLPVSPMDEAAEADAALAEAVLSGFDPLQYARRADAFDWGPQVFLGSAPHGEPIAGPVGLVGGRRCFLFGPFFHLPRGLWKATVDFAVRDNLSGNMLKVDVYTDEVVMEASARLPIAGRFSFSIVFPIEEPRLPVQLRLFNEQGAIEGEFEIMGVRVSRQD